MDILPRGGDVKALQHYRKDTLFTKGEMMVCWICGGAQEYFPPPVIFHKPEGVRYGGLCASWRYDLVGKTYTCPGCHEGKSPAIKYGVTYGNTRKESKEWGSAHD